MLFYCLVFLATLVRFSATAASPYPVCDDAPSYCVKFTCEALHKMDASGRRTAEDPSILPQIDSKPEYFCMDLECLCEHFENHGHDSIESCVDAIGKARRKEYRMLTDRERRRYHHALNKLKKSGEYDKLALVHHYGVVYGPGHGGPSFLPWHREHIKWFEIALRRIDPTLAVPYWDSTLDQALPDPRDSILWTDDFMGATDEDGRVVTGDFAYWRTSSNRSTIIRNLDVPGGNFTLFRCYVIEKLINHQGTDQMLGYSAPMESCSAKKDWRIFEYPHTYVHAYVGGDMLPGETAADDPLFWGLHSFVDHVWELHRQNQQTRYERSSSYPGDNTKCGNPIHFGDSNLWPYQKTVREGLSNKYTDNLYEFAPRPTCTIKNPDCGSKYDFCPQSYNFRYLFCHVASPINPVCVAKIKRGGNCRGFNDVDKTCQRMGLPFCDRIKMESMNPCYKSKCVDDKCV